MPVAWDFDAYVPGSMALAEEAKAACWSCAVRVECLAAALEAGERFGIWGALDPAERRRLAA
ncbi:WhiB family transcriptional regulator [Georgenia sp. AZ-5]|uniref:WhiB family transcriptional regulator n=1 Tax=Georgenia sp. AZ-5 TaxID=3367526 RepID=UPI00375420B1